MFGSSHHAVINVGEANTHSDFCPSFAYPSLNQLYVGNVVSGRHREMIINPLKRGASLNPRIADMTSHAHSDSLHKDSNHYGRLLLMIVLSFIAMYGLMYAMVNSAENVRPNFNQFYMAGLMTAAMVVIELSLMGGMYHNKRLNAGILSAGAVALIVFWMFTRQQVAISDKQFLKSMIPHHAGAILMCERAPIIDAEIKRLCQTIISSQQSEIDQMKAKLQALEK